MKSRIGLVLVVAAAVGCRRHSGASAVPPDPPPQVIESKVIFRQITLSKFPEHERLWVYEPQDGHRTHPCVFIAPAGSPLVTGMKLTEDDRSEHLPYVRAGFTVVAYDVSGEGSASDPVAVSLFAKRRFGLDNGKAAIDAAVAQVAIDPLRMYVAGHSSAGTLALQLAAADSRIRGCIAYAPVTDVTGWLGPVAMGRLPANAASEITKISPAANLENLKCPVMLFTAADDKNVPTGTVSAFAEKLKALGRDVTLVTADSGGHYDSMIREGIPNGIKWLQRSR